MCLKFYFPYCGDLILRYVFRLFFFQAFSLTLNIDLISYLLHLYIDNYIEL